MALTQTWKKEPWRKCKTNNSFTVYNFLIIDGHTETPFVMGSGVGNRHCQALKSFSINGEEQRQTRTQQLIHWEIRISGLDPG